MKIEKNGLFCKIIPSGLRENICIKMKKYEKYALTNGTDGANMHPSTKTAAPAARKGMRHDEAALQQQHDDDHDAHVRHVHALQYNFFKCAFHHQDENLFSINEKEFSESSFERALFFIPRQNEIYMKKRR